MLTGTYLPGSSLLHRARPGVKVGTLTALMLILFLAGGPVTVAVIGSLTVAAYAVARVPFRVGWAQVWPLRWFVAALFAYQAWVSGWGAATVVCANLVVAVAAASLVTLTTRVNDMLSSLVAGLERVPTGRLDPERLGVACALTIRSIPVVSALAVQTREARSARGLDRSLRAFATPTVIRTVRHAERVGDALVARGWDD